MNKITLVIYAAMVFLAARGGIAQNLNNTSMMMFDPTGGKTLLLQPFAGLTADRTFTFPDNNGTVLTTPGGAFTGKQVLLSVAPGSVAEAGAMGDLQVVAGVAGGGTPVVKTLSSGSGISIVSTATAITFSLGPGGSQFHNNAGNWSITNGVGAGTSNSEISVAGGDAGILYQVVPASGTITGVAVSLNNPVTAGTMTVEVTKNGSGTGFTVVLGVGTQYASNGAGAVSFNAGDRLGIRYTTSAGFTPNNARMNASVMVID